MSDYNQDESEWLSDEEEVKKKFEHVDKRLDLRKCNTRDDILDAFVRDPKADMRVINLIQSGFVEKILEMKLVSNYRKEHWKTMADGTMILVRRDEHGRFLKGDKIVRYPTKKMNTI